MFIFVFHSTIHPMAVIKVVNRPIYYLFYLNTNRVVYLFSLPSRFLKLYLLHFSNSLSRSSLRKWFGVDAIAFRHSSVFFSLLPSAPSYTNCIGHCVSTKLYKSGPCLIAKDAGSCPCSALIGFTSASNCHHFFIILLFASSPALSVSMNKKQ